MSKAKTKTTTSTHLTPTLVCESINVSIDTVLSWIHSKQLKASNIASGSRPRWRISKADLQAFMDERSNVAKTATKAKRQPKKASRQYV